MLTILKEDDNYYFPNGDCINESKPVIKYEDNIYALVDGVIYTFEDDAESWAKLKEIERRCKCSSQDIFNFGCRCKGT